MGQALLFPRQGVEGGQGECEKGGGRSARWRGLSGRGKQKGLVSSRAL